MGMRKLLGKMAEAGLTRKSLAKEIGISANSLGDKIKGIRAFNTNEIEAICNVLGIKDPAEKALIFLT